MVRRPNCTSAWAKIERAKEHRDVLEAKIADFFSIKANRPRGIGKYEADAGCHIFRIAYVPPNLAAFVGDASLAVGDIVSNLRSALDHLAYQLALVEASCRGSPLTAEERKNVYFPIHTRRWTRDSKADVRRFGGPSVAVIKHFQPYRGRAGDGDGRRYRHQLTLLRQLSNRDKHRLLVVVAAVPDRIKTGMFPPGVRLRITGRKRVQLRAEFGRATFPDVEGEVDVTAEMTPTISFPQGWPVISSVDRIAAYVVEIVRQFDPLA